MTTESLAKQSYKVGFWGSSENAPIFLAQSDTTAGFLCSSATKLNAIKGRLESQNALLTLDSFKKLKSLVRPPNQYKNKIRKSARKTFVYRGRHALMSKDSFHTMLAIRVIKPDRFRRISHADFLQFFPFLYSSSANAHKKGFALGFALQNANVIILDERGLKESNPSKIYKVSNHHLKCIR
ncbi:hypothetical protein [Helicobacter sp.]|uniref:hypothetical protein n=1 Tax=Helicobacter sp. TaxID=218 RepID=UPI0025C09019|nr:hypothetical protein [Helicobacter sp.]